MWAQRNAAMMVAARRGEWDKIKRMLSDGKGFKPNTTGDGGMTLLMLAARGGAVEVCAALLAGGADPNSRDTASGSTALVHAASAPTGRSGDLPGAILTLIEASADPEMVNDAGRTPLIISSEAGLVDRVQALLEGGANPNTIGRARNEMAKATGLKQEVIDTFIHGHTSNALLEWCKYRRAQEEEEEKNRHQLALMALNEREAEMKQQVSAITEEEEGMWEDDDNMSDIPDEAAAMSDFDRRSERESNNYFGDEEEDESSSEGDQDQWRENLTMFVSEVAPLRARDLRKAEPTAEELSDWTAASATLRRLVRINVGEDSATALVGAARQGHADVCKLLVQHGADVQGAGLAGEAALCEAAFGGHFRVCEVLLAAGDMPWQAVVAALEIAEAHGHLDVAAMLRGRRPQDVAATVLA